MQYNLHMHRTWEEWYLEALRAQNLADVARVTGRGYRTLHSYLRGERGVPRRAAEELAGYLRAQAETLTTAADHIEAALAKEENER